MGTRAILLRAGPTPWDMEDRIVGSRSLPLTAEAVDLIRKTVEGWTDDVVAVYRPSRHEACDQAAKIVAHRYQLRPRDNMDLDAVKFGLWEGLTLEDIRHRFPTVFPHWQENPLAVTPPNAEPLGEAISRISKAAMKIIRRNRGYCIVLAVRPRTAQIIAGIIDGESAEQIAAHLHESPDAVTIVKDIA
jgi:broad specificity phosphatase PhoE